MNKRVIITGGTGLLGTELVSRLLEDGYNVIATTSKREKATETMDKLPGLIIKQVNFTDDTHIENFEKYIGSIGKVDFLIKGSLSCFMVMFSGFMMTNRRYPQLAMDIHG